MLDDFLLRAALACLGVALVSGLLGCFVVWRRMAYFGDATAHAAILGVALSLALALPVSAGVLILAGVMGLAVHRLASNRLGSDAVLGVMAHGALAIGLVAVALVPGARVNLEAYLFGDVLTVTPGDLALIWGGGAAVALVLWRLWPRLLTATVSPDLAHAAGIDPARMRLVLTLLLAVVVAVAIRAVGALLVTALLVIPAAAARPLATTPERMATAAAGLGAISALGGLALALRLDTPVGPSVVSLAALLFAAVSLGAALRRRTARRMP